MNITVLENSQSYAETVAEYLKSNGHTVNIINTTGMRVDAAITAAKQIESDCLLVDNQWKDGDAMIEHGRAFMELWDGCRAILYSSVPELPGYKGEFISKLQGLPALLKLLTTPPSP